MSEITLQHHRTVWHFVPGLALSAVVTGVALWGGSIPAVAGAGFSALTLAILLGMVVGNTVYPHIWKSCDGGVIFAKQHHPLWLPSHLFADCGCGCQRDCHRRPDPFEHLFTGVLYRPEDLWTGQTDQLADRCG